jgi:hypothetical protein
MRTKLTALIVACAALALAAIAQAAPIPVAVYTFASQDDVNAFQKVFGAKCTKKWSGHQALGILVGAGTSSCVLRTSVVADSSDAAPDHAIQGDARLARAGGSKTQRKAFVGVGVRQGEEAGYYLRVLPFARKWQLIRDPKGGAGPATLAVGTGKFIRPGMKPNSLQLRAFDRGTTTTQLLAVVNGRTVVSTTDAAADQPDGRRTVVTDGVKGSGAGTGVSGVFDEVSVRVPNPFG